MFSLSAQVTLFYIFMDIATAKADATIRKGLPHTYKYTPTPQLNP